jgi:hypothetical protein
LTATEAYRSQAIINLFRHYGGGQAGGKRCAQGIFELIARQR